MSKKVKFFNDESKSLEFVCNSVDLKCVGCENMDSTPEGLVCQIHSKCLNQSEKIGN